MKYQIRALRCGQFDAKGAQSEWWLRARFYSATGTDLGYDDLCYGRTLTTTWQQEQCFVYAPGSATSLKLQLWLVQQNGWVAFDDLTVDSKDAGVGSYYYFGGQRIAMFDAEGLKHLHTDHLNSTTLVTDGSGAVAGTGQRYYAYGNGRSGDIIALPTEYAFTGQRYDNVTGLIYMNARYYDPELGIFISPDTSIPDPTNVMDYNRYMFGRGNPNRWRLCHV